MITHQQTKPIVVDLHSTMVRAKVLLWIFGYGKDLIPPATHIAVRPVRAVTPAAPSWWLEKRRVLGNGKDGMW